MLPVFARIWPLILAQACGALNDNLVRNAVIVLALFRLGEGGTGFAALAGALLMAPSIFLSATAGQIADRYAKPRVVLVTRLVELGLMLGVAVAFACENVAGLLAALFGMGVQGAMFGPVKYGILPELLAECELVAGNGLMEGTTFVSIVTATVLGGALILAPHGTLLVSSVGLCIAGLGVFGALRLPSLPAAAPSLRVGWNIFAETWHLTRHAMAVRPIARSILALSWFWTIGATLMAELPVLTRDTVGAEGHVLTVLLSVFAVGVGAGSLGCARLLRGAVSVRYVPLAGLCLSVFLADFAWASGAFHAARTVRVGEFLGAAAGWRMMADLFLAAASGGMFSVPLYAMLQDLSEPTRRARTIAANNVVNALMMVVGAAAASLLAPAIGAAGVLLTVAAVNLGVAAWSLRLLPIRPSRVLLRWYISLLHGVDVIGMEHYRAAGGRVVIVSNHLSYADAALISAFLPDSPAFAIHTHQLRQWWVRIAASGVRIFPVDIGNPFAVKRMIEAVRDEGEKLVVFPEGRITQTGALMKIFEGAAVVADRAGAKVVPMTIDGTQFTPFGHMAGVLKLRWFPRLRLTVHPAVTLAPPDAQTLAPRRRRERVGRALHDVMVESQFRARNIDRTLFAAVLDARDLHGGKTLVAEDINRAPISFDRLRLGAAALGRALMQGTGPGEIVGLMMPNANATLVAFLGMSAFGRVPAMLNFSAGADAMLGACTAAGVRCVVSSKTFVEKAKLQSAVARMQSQVRFVWLEDVRARIGLAAKLRATWDAGRARRLPGAQGDPNAPCVVLFTSGSEGTPKGVVLSHRNILANCAQLACAIDFNPADRVFTALPMFHSFGLVAGTLLPLLNGVRVFLYPSPLHYRTVPALIYDSDATLCFGTDVFLQGWAKYAHPYDFYRMRYIFAGAERVREETKQLFAEKFGVRVLEGYGATETAPVLALNTAMHTRAGTVGRLLPGIAHRLVPVAGIEAGGRLLVKGPNVMLGYMRATAPGIIEPPPDGWYDTGDIVSLDAQGFVTITGRAKRFAKIAGEMVSLGAAEALVSELWPNDQHAVVAVADARKGEQLLLVTTRDGGDVREILAHARSRGVGEMAVPRTIVRVDALPLLGSGKVNYPAVQEMMNLAVAA